MDASALLGRCIDEEPAVCECRIAVPVAQTTPVVRRIDGEGALVQVRAALMVEHPTPGVAHAAL